MRSSVSAISHKRLAAKGTKMSRFLLVLTVVVFAAGGVGSARGGLSSGVDLLVGAYERPAILPTTLIHGSVLAISGPTGEKATGFFTGQAVADGVGFPFAGKVTCLRVEGNRAVAGGVVTRSEAATAPVGSGVLIQVTDNGSPGAGHDTNLNFLNFGGTDEELTTCPFTDVPGVAEITITRGNLVVHDG